MRSALLLFASLALSAVTLQAEESADDEQSALPALKILPVGSSIHDLKAPRFDDNYNMTSLLTAKRMDIVSKQKLSGDSVELTLFKQNAPQAATHLKSAFYWPNEQILHAPSNLTITGQRFDIAAQGLNLHLEKQAGFLLGNTQTIFYSDRDQTMTPSPSQPQQKAPKTPLKSAKKLGLALATFPALLTAEELQEIDTLAQPSTPQLISANKQALEQIQKVQQVTTTIDQSKTSLDSTITKAVGTTEHTAAANKPIQPQANKLPVTISSADGMYFDALNSIIVYSNDVKVTHPKYKLNCAGELKVKFTPNPKLTTDTKAAENKAVDSLDLFKNLDEKIESGEVFVTAVATGGVVIQSKNNKGERIVAKAQTVSYNGETGITVLKGGRPTITQGNTIVKLKSNTGYITILPNMSVRIAGPHEINTALSSSR